MRDRLSSLGTDLVAPSPIERADEAAVVGTVVIDWQNLVVVPKVGGAVVADRVKRLLELGVDVVLRGGEGIGDAGSELGAADTNPGRLVVLPEGIDSADALRDGPEAVLVVGDRPLLDALDAVIASLAGFPRPVPDESWLLPVEGFDPEREHHVESWFTVANGRTGTRGSVEEPMAASAPAVYVAGVYGRPTGDDPAPTLAPGPEWTHLLPRAGGEVAGLDVGETLEHRRVLDLRQGILFRHWRQRLGSGQQWSYRSARFASLADRAVLALQVDAGCAGAEVTLDDGTPSPDGHPAVESVERRIVPGGVVVAVQARDGRRAEFAVATAEDGGALTRVVAVSRHPASGSSTERIGDDAAPAAPDPAVIDTLRARHRVAWRDRWAGADVTIHGDDRSQRALRFSLYHLIGSGDPESDVASIGARGLTGPGYRGHVFWDTEIFILPFFIWTHPPTARALLAYRYRTLPAARAKAAACGYEGALYPWEAADTGEETTPEFILLKTGAVLPVVNAEQEHHISADVAWAVWEYWRVTGDDVFLVEMGAEIILETARFWVSRVESGGDGRLHIRRAIGPDEYHEAVDDNAFTNVMAKWNIERALELAQLLPRLDPQAWPALAGRLGIADSEVQRWRDVADALFIPFDPATLLYEQFEGFFHLDDVEAEALAPRPFGGEVVLGVDFLRRSQVVKQADVVMLAHLLAGVVPPDVALANYRYYEPRTSHGSSLSPAIHAAVAARVGEMDAAEQYFELAAGIDLDDRMGNAAEGVHLATMGGLWQAAVIGFGGLRGEADHVRIDPRLPRHWGQLDFPVQWRGTRIRVKVCRETLTVRLDGPAAVAAGTGPPVTLAAGTYFSRRTGDGWSTFEATEVLV